MLNKISGSSSVQPKKCFDFDLVGKTYLVWHFIIKLYRKIRSEMSEVLLWRVCYYVGHSHSADYSIERDGDRYSIGSLVWYIFTKWHK